MRPCPCTEPHQRRRVVLTGGPGAGKTAVLEATADWGNPAIVPCDRGTVGASAYWPGPGDFWAEVGTTLQEQSRRYDAFITCGRRAWRADTIGETRSGSSRPARRRSSMSAS